MCSVICYLKTLYIHSFVIIQHTMWLKKLIPRLQPFVCLTLFISFLLIFGLPAYTKYRTYEVYIKESVVEAVDGLKSPAMTICVDLVMK